MILLSGVTMHSFSSMMATLKVTFKKEVIWELKGPFGLRETGRIENGGDKTDFKGVWSDKKEDEKLVKVQVLSPLAH